MFNKRKKREEQIETMMCYIKTYIETIERTIGEQLRIVESTNDSAIKEIMSKAIYRLEGELSTLKNLKETYDEILSE